MAKSLAERITSARNTSTARITDLEKLIPEAELERDRLSQAAVAASGESVDFALSDEDRDEAAAKAERYSRTARGLDIAIAELREKLDGLRSSEAQKASEAEKKSAIAERDEIVAEFEAFMPKAIERMVKLFERIEANSNRLRTLGVAGPCAEAKARGLDHLPLPGMLGGSSRYTAMKIPAWDNSGRAWPKPPPPPVHFDYAGAMTQARRQREQDAEQQKRKAEEHAKNHGIYCLSTGLVQLDPVRTGWKLADKYGFPRGIRYGDPWEGELPHSVAEELRKVEHLDVELLQPEAAQ